jgi:renalase
MKKISSCLIVGAGISGLLAARTLAERGMRVTLIEKSMGVGGRMATRRIGKGACDHGAQYISVGRPEFGALVARWQQLGLVATWAENIPDSAGRYPGDVFPRFRGVPAMTAVPKFLASQLQIHCGQRALRADPTPTGWRVFSETGIEYAASALIVTLPVPQALALFADRPGGGIAIDLEPIKKIAYSPVFAALYVLGGPSLIPTPGALFGAGEVVSWIVDNFQKGISPDATTVTVHTRPSFTTAMFDAPDKDVLQKIAAEVAPLIGDDIVEAQLHRWRYAEPTFVMPERFHVGSPEPILLFAGDGFGGSRIEAAALSGIAAAEHLIALQT